MAAPQLKSVAIVGGGPAGLYLAYRLKRRLPGLHVRVYEQNSAGATFGFGVVFSDQALAFLDADDPETAAAITPHMQTWQDMRLNLRGEVVTIDGIGFSSIGRLQLLQLLQGRAAKLGAEILFETPIANVSALDQADLIVGADGLNSVVRASDEAGFATSLSYFDNRFMWYGTTQTFETLTQTFVMSEWGAFNAHHYRYASGFSTFIVECGPETWRRAGFADMDDDAARARCESIFADTLGGYGLIANKSQWRNFPKLWNDVWSVGNRVLLGDALHTAHFSIGSGTRLAIEDAIA
ncbi:MAG: FAD-dependent monooxygenase, partial [Hyphomicrobiaceae bacterium]